MDSVKHVYPNLSVSLRSGEIERAGRRTHTDAQEAACRDNAAGRDRTTAITVLQLRLLALN